MRRFFLIIEARYGTTIKVNVPDRMNPAEALEWYYASHDDRARPIWHHWRTRSQMVGFQEFVAAELGDTITFHDPGVEVSLNPADEPPTKVFDTWVATSRPTTDLGAALKMPDLNGQAGFLYEGGYLEDFTADAAVGNAPAKYHLLIEHDEWWSDDRAELEARLFFQWVWPEGYTAQGGVA